MASDFNEINSMNNKRTNWTIILCTAVLTGIGLWVGGKVCEGVALVVAIPQMQMDMTNIKTNVAELKEHRCRCGEMASLKGRKGDRE